MRTTRTVVFVLLLGLIISACGARLDKNVRNEAANAVLNGSGGGGNGSALGNSGNGLPGSTGNGLPGSTGNSNVPGSTGNNNVPGSTGNNSVPGSTGGGSTGPGGGGGGNTGPGTGGNHQTAACGTSGTDVGLTSNSILLGTIADVTGPVSGLFQGAFQGMQAFREYINSTGGICGHSINVKTADSGTNCKQEQDDTEQLGQQVFAFVGTFSLYDNCGSAYINQHKIPDLHVQLAADAGKEPTNYDMEPGPLGYATGMFAYYAHKYGAKVKAVGTLYPSIPSVVAKQNAFVNSSTHEGWKYVYSRAVDATENDWTQDFVKMCHPTNGQPAIQIFFTAAENASYAAKMVQDEGQAGCPSSLINIIPIAYDQAFPPDVGNDNLIEGLQGWNEYSLFFNTDEAQHIPELKLLQQWFQQANGNKPMNLYALFAWAQARLFQQAAEAAGPTLNRQTLLAALAKIHNFSDGGIMAPVDPSSKTVGVKCYILWEYHNHKYERIDDPSTGYRCDGQFLPYKG